VNESGKQDDHENSRNWGVLLTMVGIMLVVAGIVYLAGSWWQ
jgi:hypothetical protein